MKNDRTWEIIYSIPQKLFSFHATRPVLLLRGLVLFVIGILGVMNPVLVLTTVTMILGGVVLLFAIAAFLMTWNSGRVSAASNHDNSFRSFTTLPTMKIAGGLIPFRFTSSAALPSVVTSVRCSGFVPQRMTAAGVSAARPPPPPASTITAGRLNPIWTRIG